MMYLGPLVLHKIHTWIALECDLIICMYNRAHPLKVLLITSLGKHLYIKLKVLEV